MKAVILNGSEKGDAAIDGVHQIIIDELEGQGWEVEPLILHEMEIHHCVGCFGCWVKTPGVCVINDAGRDAARAVTFGGYSSQLKKALDRAICLVTPFFTKVNGEIHHVPRYERYPRIMGVGVLPQADKRHPAHIHDAGWLQCDQCAHSCSRWGRDPQQPGRGRNSERDPDTFSSSRGKIMNSSSQERVLLWVGSAKRPRSTSESLGTYLCERLGERGFETEMPLLHRALKSDQGREDLLAATDRADVVAIAFPLYVDSLPYLVIRTMELVAQHRQGRGEGKKQRLVAIANCGFPEAHQNDTALAICRQFAREAGFEWAGGLALGGGEAISGQPLPKVKGMARNVIGALDLTATALAEGKPVPQETIESMAKPITPAWMYTLLGGIGWKRQAKKHGTQKKLYDRPYHQS